MKFFKKNKNLPYIEDYYTNSGPLNGLVVMITSSNLLYGPDISRSHTKGLESLLFQAGFNNNFDSKTIWNELQLGDNVLFRLTKLDLSVVYMPNILSDFQYNNIIDIINQMDNYVLKKKKNISLVVSDLEQGELILQLDEFRNYLDSKFNKKIL